MERCGATGGFLTPYVRTPSRQIKRKIRPAMIVFPGGGYEFLSDREGEPVALQFMAAGYSSFVMDYSIKTAYPVPLIEACMAIACKERIKKEYGSAVRIGGFSKRYEVMSADNLQKISRKSRCKP